MKRLAIGLAVAVLSLLPGSVPAHGLCSPKEPSAPEAADPFAYLSAVIDSLGHVKEGRSHVMAESSAPAEFLYNAKAAQDGYACAASIIESFAQSADTSIALSARSLSLAYRSLISGDQAVVEELVALLDQADKGQPAGYGTMLNRLTELRHANDKIWRSLPVAVISATYTLPSFDNGKATGRFRITKAQRRQLTRALEEQFGSSVRAGIRGGQLPLEAAAGALYQFLADRKWHSADD